MRSPNRTNGTSGRNHDGDGKPGDESQLGEPVRSALAGAIDRERALDAHQASPIIGAAPITMAQWRARGAGPPWFRSGRSIRYRLGDLLDWRDARTVGKRGGAR